MRPSWRARFKFADAAAVFIIFFVIFCIYGRAVFFDGDIWDDQSYLSVFRNGTSLKDLFRLLKTPVLGLHSPLVTFTFWLEAVLFGAGNAIPVAHVGNIFLFFVGAVGLYGVFRSVTVPGMPENLRKLPVRWALAGTLLWCCQPQRVESVAWISERKDVLLACCTWWSWLFFIRAYRAKRFGFAAFFLFLLSFAVKPMLVFFPALLGVWICLETGRKRDISLYRSLIPYAAVSLAMIVLQIGNVCTPSSLAGNPLWERIPVLLWCLGNYVATAVIPIGFGPFHPFYPEPGWGLFCITDLLLLLWLAAVLRFARHRELLLWGIGGALAGALFLLGPMAGLMRFGNADWADRYNLLSSALLLMIPTFAAAVGAASRRRVVRYMSAAGFAALLLWNAVESFNYLPVWRNSDTVIKRAMAEEIPNYRVIFVVACRALEDGDAARYAAAVKRLPPEHTLTGRDAVDVAVFHRAMAAAWAFRAGRSDEGAALTFRLFAEKDWRRITAVSDGFPQLLLVTAAEHCLRKNAPLAAAEILEKLAECYPGAMDENFYKGYACLYRGDYERALSHFEDARRKAPGDARVLRILEETKHIVHRKKSGVGET